MGGGPFFLCGPGDPEGFLYRGTRNANGTRKGDQMALINKLAGTGANCIYLMAIRSHGGDGDTTENPYVNSDLSRGLDEDILSQWETWLTAMDDNGIVAFFIFYDDGSSPFGRDLPTGGELKPEEAAFIDALVARFKHHRHLIWCVAEEYGEGLSPAHAVKIAERIKERDDQHHPVAIHQNHGTSFDFAGRPAFNQFAVQWNVSTAQELHAGTRAAWNSVAGLANVNMAEFANAGTGSVLRKKLWAIASGGGYSMVLGMDIASTPVGDLEDCGRLVRFMEATRFNETSPHDELAGGDTDYVLARPGQVYIAYTDSGEDLAVSLLAGNYTVQWYDPAGGVWFDAGLRAVAAAGAITFSKPGSFGAEAALYLAVTAPAPAYDPSPANGDPAVVLPVSLSWTAGVGASTHDVYFGTVSPGTYQGNQTSTSFKPGLLERGRTYFWRVDETNQAGTTIGDVWSFRTRALAGDADGDGDVDQDDFGLFQACYSGPGAPPIPLECLFADLNGDEVVDQSDLATFRACLSGADVPAEPDCDRSLEEGARCGVSW